MSDGETMNVIQAEVAETLQWCLRVLVHQDEAGAALHLQTVQYSPLTFSVAQSLHSLFEAEPEVTWPLLIRTMVHNVLSHMADFDVPLFPRQN